MVSVYFDGRLGLLGSKMKWAIIVNAIQFLITSNRFKPLFNSDLEAHF